MRNKLSFISVATLALGLYGNSANGGPPFPAPEICDFITGGGFIVRDSGAKGTFGAGAGCKHGQTWGHLEYHDHGTGLNVHWLTITGYFTAGPSGAPDDPKRTGTRIFCGTARSNQFADVVDFMVRMTDKGEPGVDDVFKIRLGVDGVQVYTTGTDSNNTLGGDGPGGGNIQLHKPNQSTSEVPPNMDCPFIPE